MTEPLDDSLRTITRGTGIALVGMTLGLLFSFITRLIIARYSLQDGYGIFSLALVVLNLATTISGLGLLQGATRYIAYFRGTHEEAKIRGTMFVSLWFSVAASIIIALVVFLAANTIAVTIFHNPELAPALKLFAIAIPFLTLINTLVAFFRGFDRVGPGIYFQSIALNAIVLVLLVAIVVAGLPFVSLFYAYLGAVIVTFIATTIYTARRLPQRIGLIKPKGAPPITKELLSFSLPLLGSAIMSIIMMRIDTLMLGYFKTMALVGLYNAAFPIARFISEPLDALRLIYIPVATGLYSQNLTATLRRNYTILTKWLVTITLPIFLVLVLYPEAVLYISFGHGYLPAASALRILSIGFIINNFLGPNGATLLAMGHPKLIMWATLATVIMNVVLNITLIPPLGIVGAAIASVVSITAVNIIRSWKLYSLSRVHPLSKNLFKPVIISVVLAFLIQILVQSLITVTAWMLPILFILYCGIYGLAVLFTRSFDKEDMAMLLEIEKRSGINVTPLKKLLGRFL